MSELGRIEKPDAGSYAGTRKLYCIPHMPVTANAPEDYRQIVMRFWDEVGHQLERLEVAGRATQAFIDMVEQEGGDAMKAIGELNPRVAALLGPRVDAGLIVFPLETHPVFEEYVDWANCLNVVTSPAVSAKVFNFFSEVAARRLDDFARLIDSRLAPGSAAVLIMKDEDRMRLKLPHDIELFLVTPPSYDDLLRWFRARFQKA